jgi:serine/threonine-protein kinase
MTSFDRYELLDTIASGDFATVHRARDRELGREVAIKQIHAQFLHDERHLARYWQEAQLLASLQHPHVLTIYDVVRSRGWLVLELMRGSLRQAVETGPLDLDFLRLALACSLSGLHFLHTNGVVHGDVKPSNLLVDAQNRVKLGDFGLARRATSDEGSLLKGTTKYMAPELLSNQFGPVGPASDLYSLGFAAYELMCGPEFENLFPGLSSFGRDRQLAWMMWHAAPDRQMPEIGRVLHGVPPDLTRVIQRLVAKDQSQRYKSAREALEDLRSERAPVVATQAAAPTPPAPRRGRRLLVGGAVIVSLVLTLAMLLPRGGGRKAAPAAVTALRGTVRNVFADERKFTLESTEDGRAREITVKTGDPIIINGKSQLIYDLRAGDRVLVRFAQDAAGRPVTEVKAAREEVSRGVIKSVLAAQGRLIVAGEADGRPTELAVDVPASLAITLNGKPRFENRSVTLADLKPGDRAEVASMAEPGGRKAVRLAAERVVGFRGVLRATEPTRREFTFALGAGDTAELVTLPLADACEVTLNNQRNIQQRLARPADLLPGDEVAVQHDTKIVRMDARRVFRAAGTLEKIDYATRLLELRVQGKPAATVYLAHAACTVELSGQRAGLDDLRVGDALEVTYDTPDAQIPEARSIAAQRAADPRRMALVLAGGKFDDATLSDLKHAEADAALVREALVKRYHTSENQVLTLSGESLVRLEQGIPKFLARANAESRLLVYVVTHAYRDADGAVYLAPLNFDFRRMSSTGLKLQWLVDQLEQCPAREKLLVLDTCHAGDKADVASQPSAAEMIRTLKAPTPGLAPLRTVTVIAACRAGQRGLVLADRGTGLLAASLAAGYAGAADKNRDGQVEATELLAYLDTAMAEAARPLGKQQSPELFLPDARPPRLSENAKKAVRLLGAFLRQNRADMEKVNLQYVTTEQLAGKEIEPKLLYGLLLMRAKQRDEAQRRFEEVGLERPGEITAGQAVAWLQFDRQACQAGVEALIELVNHIKVPKAAADPLSEDLRRVLFWAGELRQFAVEAAAEGRRAPETTGAKLDAAVAAHGPEAGRWYAEGRAKTRATMAEFDKQIAGADETAAARIRIQRKQLLNYTAFPFDDALQRILAGLDQ